MFRRFRGAEKQFGLPFGSRLIQYKEKEEIMGLYDVKTQLDEALSPSVFLPSGGQLHITETPACITVDVDTGLSDRIKGRKFVRDTNLEAAQMLARQIRLRNLGGKIIVDFVRNKNRKDGQILIDTLKVELSSDENSTSVLGFTKLGLLELLRSRRSMSLNDLMLEHETFGALRKRNFMTIAYEVLRQIDKTARFYPGRPITVRAHCRVKDILNNDLRGDLNKAIEKIGIPILLTDDDNISQDTIEVYPT